MSYNDDFLIVFINVLKWSYKKKQVINEVTKMMVYKSTKCENLIK